MRCAACDENMKGRTPGKTSDALERISGAYRGNQALDCGAGAPEICCR